MYNLKINKVIFAVAKLEPYIIRYEFAEYEMKGIIWNPWHGCHRCSEGCAHCFVFYLDGKRGVDSDTVRRSKTNFQLPLKKDRVGNYKVVSGTEVATCFTSDFFIEEADEWRREAWDIIKRRKDLNFLICTKRIKRAQACLPDDWNGGYENVAIAVSCENRRAAETRLPYLIELPAKKRYAFLSPILEYVPLENYLSGGFIDMVSVGGESYDNARPCDFEWIKKVRADCDKYGVKFDFHQTGSNFVYNGRQYSIKHRDEYSQAKKAMEFLRKQ